ncbi:MULTISPECIES: hypothetical protein [unclassified Pseudomonas]|uniref:hypothetical protein n=1 Tax=unclassified Pseudomonas TaxID=196821 RepID=UPI0011A06754|nr:MULTISPECIES: hypothetical protein [unclassified Pseudomonas]TWC12500.1 hypothetical protein FBY00_12513 [Pseudomonas sp. SJZ075]TWC28944.1 hypothetical protein FBY02_12677 [Pseudomonas sp. SJZ078]TWC49478.1 hypothetical protein FBY11_12577 [Pseudomonas sp. SJZ124]TWC84658.1 hypothetical protein FBY09_12513 [Pseudomonas sp. SJZ101]
MTQRFTSEEIQAALDTITDQLKLDGNLIAVEFEANETITVRYRRDIPKDLPAAISLRSNAEGCEHSIAINARISPDITHALGDPTLHPPKPGADEAVEGAMGGDKCWNVNSKGYGTVSFYAGSAVYMQQGSCNVNMRTSPVLISNNHVIARSDAGKLGEEIQVEGAGMIAQLDAFLPLRCNGDLAFAQVKDWSRVRSCQVRRIGGVVTKVRRPVLGEDIRKYGARTHLTGGIVEAQANINLDNGHWFRGVYRTSRGFGCPGDSGSVVVANDRRILGLYSWGERIPCEDDPAGWFWPFPVETPLHGEPPVDIFEVQE